MTDTRMTSAGSRPSTLSSAADDLSTAAKTVKEDAGRLAKTVKEDATRLAETAKDEILHRAETVKEDVRAKVEDGKSAAAHSLETFATAVRRAGDELQGQDQTTTARLVSEAANGLEGFSRLLNEKSIDGVVDSVRSFAKANPTAFIAGSVLAGIALGRFIRSSSHHTANGARSATDDRWNGSSDDTRSFDPSRGDRYGERSETAWTGQSGGDRTRRAANGMNDGEQL